MSKGLHQERSDSDQAAMASAADGGLRQTIELNIIIESPYFLLPSPSISRQLLLRICEDFMTSATSIVN